MACLDQILWIIQFVGGPAVVIGVTIWLFGWFGLFPVFQYVDCVVHQYPWYGRTRRTINAKIRMKLGILPASIQASLILIKDGETLPEKYWLAWEEPMNPDKITIAPSHAAWVRVLSVDEHDKKTGVPLAVGDGRIGFPVILDGEYDVQLWVRCSFWSRNEGKKLLNTWHWRVPDDIMNAKYEA